MQNIEQQILEYLTEPRLVQEVSAHLGVVESTVWSALRRLQGRGEIVKFGKGKNGSNIWIKNDSESTGRTTARQLLTMKWR